MKEVWAVDYVPANIMRTAANGDPIVRTVHDTEAEALAAADAAVAANEVRHSGDYITVYRMLVDDEGAA